MHGIDLRQLIDISWSAWSLGWLAAEDHHHSYPAEDIPHPAAQEMMDEFYNVMLAKKDDEHFTLYNEFVQMLIERGYVRRARSRGAAANRQNPEETSWYSLLTAEG